MTSVLANLNIQNGTYSGLLPLTTVPTNQLQAQAIEVRQQQVNWQSYFQGQMIPQNDFEVIREFDLARTAEARRDMLARRGDECARTFMSLMTKISKEQTVRYVLTIVDDLLAEDPERTRLFCSTNNKNQPSPWIGFMNMLNRNDKFIVHQASRIIAKLACWGSVRMSSQDLTYYLNWIKTQLSNENTNLSRNVVSLVSSEITDFVQSILNCLSMMLRLKEYRDAFFEMDGVTSVMALLNTKCGFQVQYQAILCIWLMTFCHEICMKMARYNPVPILADILGEAAKEKVTRIILATYKNQQSKDEDVTNDVEFLGEHLRVCLQDFSSFDEYSSELRSRRLEWSPVHKSEKFWRENAIRLNEKNYELLRILTDLLEKSQDPDILAVAAYDIGEYVRHYTRGKKIIDQLGIKQLIMQLLSHHDAAVKYNALIAVQKLMVHNWEYLGKHITSAI